MPVSRRVPLAYGEDLKTSQAALRKMKGAFLAAWAVNNITLEGASMKD